MDPQCFDAISRGLAALSRRQIARSLAGVAAGGVLSALGMRAGAAPCQKFNQPCTPRKKCCDGLRCGDGFEFEGVCCKNLGTRCDNVNECCNSIDVSCSGGKCCVPRDGAANKVEQCCDRPANLVNGICCARPGTTCTDSSECCEAMGCVNGACCYRDGAKCLADEDCCSGKCDSRRFVCRQRCGSSRSGVAGDGDVCCPEGARECGEGCCPESRKCCRGTCCEEGVTGCDRRTGKCKQPPCPEPRTCGNQCCPVGQACVGGACKACAAVREGPTADRPCCPGLVGGISGCDSGCCVCVYPVGEPEPGTGQCANGCECDGGYFATTCCEQGICSTRPYGQGC